MPRKRGGDGSVELVSLRVQQLEQIGEGERASALTGGRARRPADELRMQSSEQLRRGDAAAVAVPLEEALHPHHPKPAGLLGSRVVADEGERDLPVDTREQPRRGRVVALQDRPQLCLDRHLLGHDPLPVTHQRAQLGQLRARSQQRPPVIVLVAESVRERVRVEGVVLGRRHR